MSAAHAEEIATRGAEAVIALRTAQGPIGRWFYQDRQELLDLPGTPAAVKQRILNDVERITRMLRLDRYWARRIGRLIVEARRTRRGKPVRVLDVGAGAGGLLTRVEDWAWRRRIPVELIGIDYDPAGVEKSRRRVAEEGRRIDFRLGDARSLADFADGSVDVAVTTFMLHHLPPGDVACVLAEMDRIAAVNFMAFDLRRTLVALPALWALLRLGGFEAPSRHDATASLRRGYTVAEIEALLAAGGVTGARVIPVAPAYLVATRT